MGRIDVRWHIAVVCACAIFGVATACLSGSGYPTPRQTPPWTFDRIQVFAHASKSSPYNTSELALLKNCSIVQFDKGQFGASMPGASFEKRAAAAAQQVRGVTSDAWILWYMNLLINFPIFQPMYNETSSNAEAYLLYNTKGEMVHTLQQYSTFDHAKPAMRALFVKDCKKQVETGLFNGCFIDRANYASRVVEAGGQPENRGWDLQTARRTVSAERSALCNLTAALGPDHLVLAKEANTAPGSLDYPYANAAMPTDTFCSDYNSQSKYNKTKCLDDILAVQSYARRGQLTESHGMGPLDDAAQREFTLSCFLVAMGKLSYYAYASEISAQAWNIDGFRWFPEYDYELGEPTGDAMRDGWKFTRSFASGTTVAVDLEAHIGKIVWGHTMQ